MRAQRLLGIVEVLRRARQPVTAHVLAAELEVTPRTIYRDMAALVDMGTPIRGERGVGYQLEGGYELPPLMFDVEELEALALGLRMVAAFADSGTASNADAVLAKIEAVVPASLRGSLAEAPLYAFSFGRRRPSTVDLDPLRDAMKAQRKVRLTYTDRAGAASTRTVWPLSLGFVNGNWSLVAWCELREGFRHFRVDRFQRVEVLNGCYPGRRRGHLAAWKLVVDAEVARLR